MRIKIAKELIKIGCVKFSTSNPFQYASGLTGPIYCDNRLVLSHPILRNLIIQEFQKIISEKINPTNLLGGIATAGIPYAAILADRLNWPMVYVRGKAKEHGKKNQVEGDYEKGQELYLFEDLVNQGSSLSDAIIGIKNAGLICSKVLCIVDYQMPEAIKRCVENDLTLFSLTDFDSLVNAGVELALLSNEDKNHLKNWHNDPINWSSNKI